MYSGAETFSAVRIEWIKPDVFDGQLGLVLRVELAPPLGLSDMNPVGGSITGADKSLPPAFSARHH